MGHGPVENEHRHDGIWLADTILTGSFVRLQLGDDLAQLSVGEVCEVALEGGMLGCVMESTGTGANGSLQNCCWSRDFKAALAAASDGNWEHSVRSYSIFGKGSPGTISSSLEQVTGPGLCMPTFRKETKVKD